MGPVVRGDAALFDVGQAFSGNRWPCHERLDIETGGARCGAAKAPIECRSDKMQLPQRATMIVGRFLWLLFLTTAGLTKVLGIVLLRIQQPTYCSRVNNSGHAVCGAVE